MFDIGFWELITITLIALIIMRPEHLPKFAKDVGKFLGKLRNFIYSAKKEIVKELEIKEIHELQDSIDRVDNLMKEAPDKIISEKDNAEKNNT